MSKQFNRSVYTQAGQAPLWFAARASAFAALCAFGMQPLVGSAQVAPVAGAGTTVGTSSAGVPVVNIVAPNTSGVSNNRFDRFNVGSNGLIVNNSVNAAQTQIGGGVQGNAQLGGRSAATVLMQVTSGAASQLLGKTEIAGQGANFVLANPAGISCSGCGFLNAPRVTLSTGTPILNANGALTGFDVKQGQIAINGAGLSASNSAVDLISRAMTINGQVQAASIDAIAGANRVDYQTKHATAQDGIGEKPAVAIDVQALGSMYGNGAVRLIGTEAGVGVRDNGKITSLTGDINVSANGDVTIGAPATMQAAGNLSVRGANVANGGTLDAARGVDVRADRAFANSGSISGVEGVGLTAGTAVTNGGRVDAGNLVVNGVESVANTGTLSASGDAQIAGTRVLLDNGSIKAAGPLTLNAQTVTNQHGTLASARELNVFADRVDNTNGVLSAGTNASVQSSDRFTNANGMLTANGSVAFNGGTLDNANGKIAATQGMISASATNAVLNAGGSMQAGDALQLGAGSVDNARGTMSAGTKAVLNASFDLNNAGGSIEAGDTLFANVGSLSNDIGTMVAPHGTTIVTRDAGGPLPAPYDPNASGNAGWVDPSVNAGWVDPNAGSGWQNDNTARDPNAGQTYPAGNGGNAVQIDAASNPGWVDPNSPL